MNDRHADDLYRRLVAGRGPTDEDRRHAITCPDCRQAIEDAGRLDDRLRAAALPLATEPLPEGILSVHAASRWGFPNIRVPAVVAVLVIAAVAGLTLSSRISPIGSATPSPAPSDATASPLPTQAPSPSPRPVEPGDLVAGAYSCGDGTGGFVVWIPMDWYANAAHDGIPACRLVSNERFELTDLERPPDVPIRLTVETGDLRTTGEVIERTELMIADLPALRLVVLEENGRRLVYAVGLDGSLPSAGNPDRFVLATTVHGDLTFERDSTALEEMMSRFHGQDQFSVNPEASAAADRLFAATNTCTNAEEQFTIAYPAAWFTNPVTPATPPCSWFGAAEIDVTESAEPPVTAIIGLKIYDGALASTEPTFAYESLNVAGRPAYLTERYKGAVPETDYSFRTYQYLVQIGDLLSDGPNLVAETDTSMWADYDLAKEVLKRMMASLRLDGR